jgi:murein DD-endopeptidase MepM/ murein hydrolase activator NlpD
MSDASFFSGLTTNFTSLLKSFPENKVYIPIDLSVNNTVLSKQFTTNSSSKDWDDYFQKFREQKGVQVFYGGYLERRFLYDRSDNFSDSNSERRTMHLGIDLWCDFGTEIILPFDGVVHSFKDNIGLGNYGPTIIVEHDINNRKFFTLYGHLSRSSLLDLSRGMSLKAGEVIATLGNSSENGDYSAHLHFQVINNIQHYQGDYPGVSSERDLDFYKVNCPDPNLILKL